MHRVPSAFVPLQSLVFLLIIGLIVLAPSPLVLAVPPLLPVTLASPLVLAPLVLAALVLAALVLATLVLATLVLAPPLVLASPRVLAPPLVLAPLLVLAPAEPLVLAHSSSPQSSPHSRLHELSHTTGARVRGILVASLST
jgi:hypothetical protein